MPAQTTAEAGPEEETWEELISQVLTVWNGLAAQRAPLWRFHDQEVRALSDSWAPVARKYAGPSLSVEATALMITAGVVLPRLMASKKKNKQNAHKEEVSEENHPQKEPQAQEQHYSQEPEAEQPQFVEGEIPFE
tara:strand:+ start:1351 stop:1755 length:405 start_codon:yes stop_codon:yes gene_type:complete